MPLTDKQIKSATPRDKAYRLTDGEGLYIEVTPKGGKYWRMKYRMEGKEKRLAIGVYPKVSLKQAREKRDEARQQLNDGIDPSAYKQALKASGSRQASNSLESIAFEWISTRLADKSDAHRKRVEARLKADILPTLGGRNIAEITAVELLAELRKVEQRGAIETANRLRQIMGQLFRYAVATGRAERDPAADLRGALASPKKKHFAAVTDPAAVGRLMAAIEIYQGGYVVRAALKCSALWLCRPGELRHLKWSDVHFDAKEIRIVAEKTHQEHIIPLATQSLQILEELHPYTSRSEYVFPSQRSASRPMSENAVRVALRSMGYDNETMTPHGFRAMARTLLDEVLEYRVEWIEQQLAHAVKDANGRAYNRTKHLKQRTEMMQRYADYLDELKAMTLSGNIIPVNFRKMA